MNMNVQVIFNGFQIDVFFPACLFQRFHMNFVSWLLLLKSLANI